MKIENKWKPIKVKPRNDGYIKVELRDWDGKKRGITIHILVCEAFHGPKPFIKACVRHLDGNPLNNNYKNLSWGTYFENENDKKRHGTYNKRISNAKLTRLQVEKIRKELKIKSQKELAKEYGVSRPTITRIANNKIWIDE